MRLFFKYVLHSQSQSLVIEDLPRAADGWSGKEKMARLCTVKILILMIFMTMTSSQSAANTVVQGSLACYRFQRVFNKTERKMENK